MVSSARHVVVYVRDGCHLCEDMIEHLTNVLQPDWGFTLETRDIDRDPALKHRYNERVPVLTVNDDELFDYFIDEVALRQALEL